MNEYININEENIDKEHICCAIGDPKHQNGVKLKKEYLKSKIKLGHVFRKLNVRGKTFIEYEPLNISLVPIIGENYMYINCLWVAGSYKGKGIARELLEYCINDSKNKKMNGICTLSSKKKKPFLGDLKFFTHFNFKVVDEIGDYELLALSFNEKELPKFTDSARKLEIDNKEFTIYYNNTCPYTEYELIELSNYSKENNIKINFIKVENREQALNLPCIFNNWANFYNGKYISNTILNANSLDKIIKESK